MARDSIICIFCGRIAKIMGQDDLGIVVCPTRAQKNLRKLYRGDHQMGNENSVSIAITTAKIRR